MATNWNAYLKWVLPEVKYVPNDMALDAVRDAATEFLKVSRFWHSNSGSPYGIVPTLMPRLTVLTLPPQAKFYSILWGAFSPTGSGLDVNEVTPKSPADLDGVYPGWRTSQEPKSTPKHYTMLDVTSLRIVPWADAAGNLNLEIAFIPTADSTGGPDELFDQYHMEVSLGARGLLLMQATQKWANPQLGAAYFKQMMDKAGLASARVDRGSVEAPITTKTEYM